jgi:hypothetical protein
MRGELGQNYYQSEFVYRFCATTCANVDPAILQLLFDNPTLSP